MLNSNNQEGLYKFSWRMNPPQEPTVQEDRHPKSQVLLCSKAEKWSPAEAGGWVWQQDSIWHDQEEGIEIELEHKCLQASLLPAVTEMRHPAIPFLGHKLLQGQEDAASPPAKASAKDVTHVARTCPLIFTPFLSVGFHMCLSDFIKTQDRFCFSPVIWIKSEFLCVYSSHTH